jgi:hypothetical protein
MTSGASPFRKTAFLTKTFQDLYDLPESAEIQERQLRARLLYGSCLAVIGPPRGNGGVGAVREAQDEVRVGAAAQADDFTLLTAQGMMRMENRDESQGWLGYRGSVL